MGVIAVLSLLLTFVWILRPSQSRPERADAALLLVGGRGERIQAARELAADGTVDHVVVAAADLNPSSTFRRLCDRGRIDGASLHCLRGAADTRAEARVLSRYAKRQGWDHIVVVTSNYHLTRSRQLVARCFSGRVDGVGATPDSGIALRFGQVLHEWAGLLEAQVKRGC